MPVHSNFQASEMQAHADCLIGTWQLQDAPGRPEEDSSRDVLSLQGSSDGGWADEGGSRVDRLLSVLCSDNEGSAAGLTGCSQSGNNTSQSTVHVVDVVKQARAEGACGGVASILHPHMRSEAADGSPSCQIILTLLSFILHCLMKTEPVLLTLSVRQEL